MLISIVDVTELLSVSPSMVYKLVNTKDFPRPIKVGAAVRWDMKEVEAWIEAQKEKRDAHAA